MINPKIFIGPMSKNIVDSVIEYTNENNTPIGIIPSRRQVEHDGGYVNNWGTVDFGEYVRSKTNNVLLVRDHGGPNQGDEDDDGQESLMVDAQVMDVIHVDVWKKYQQYDDGLSETISLINLMYNMNPKLVFEVGTEESIRVTNVEELDNLLTHLKERLSESVYERVKYCVIQSGTALEGGSNVGEYDQNRLVKMVDVVKKYGMIPKEHNGDYLPKGLIKKKFNHGLECINIAPEFGGIETDVILNTINGDESLIEELYQLCFESKRWVKWVTDDYNPEENKIEIIKITGHYVFSDPKFIELKVRLGISDEEIKTKLKVRIKELFDEANN